MYDLSDPLRELIDAQSGSGLVSIFVPGSTAGITTIEHEAGCISDLKRALDQIAPEDEEYKHNEKWGDGNGFSHLRSALLGPGVTVPYKDGELQNGTWQQIVLVDNDNRPRERDVLITALGES